MHEPGRTESANGNARPKRAVRRRSASGARGWRNGLWRSLATPGRRLLMFDYDGTLAPFRVNRANAVLSPAIRRSLRRLARLPDHTLAIVSGRSLADLTRLLGNLPITLVGEHGWEERRPRGPVRRSPLAARPAIALARAAARADALGLGHRIERKRTAIVLHVRGLPAARARRVLRRALRAWRPLSKTDGLRLDRIAGGIELRAIGHDKGEVVRRLLAGRPRPDVAVYLGDDRTDEDAFAALRSHGIGVRVGPRHRATHAGGSLASPAAVREFVDQWWRRARATASRAGRG